jgi:2-keto-4-pentenoate hydratase/2-oxohepta-3-ene-1,7-dioic acid hydratase in catechol pathway
MRLVTFTDSKSTRIGVVDGGHIIDLAQAAPELPADMRLLLEGGRTTIDRVRAATAGGRGTIALGDVRLEPPVPSPRKFLALAMNYHFLEPWPEMSPADFEATVQRQRDQKAANNQWWYNKQVTAITGPYDPIHLPPDATEVYFEVELAFVIGERCRNVAREDAASVIAGYMVSDDVTVGNWCRDAPTLSLGKSYDTFGPQGPWIMTPDELGDPHNLRLTGTVNGELWESGSTKDMLFDCYDLIAFASRRFTLEPGDVVTTGMPAVPMKPLKDGDLVRCEIEGLGAIENRVTDALLPALGPSRPETARERETAPAK